MAQSFSTTLPKPTSSSSPACTLLFIFTLCILTLYTLHHHHNPHPPPSTTNPPSVSTFITSASNYTISTYLRHLTLHPHIAGTPPSSAAAAYVTSHFQSFNIPTHVTNFSVLLSYPVSSSLTAHFSNSSTVSLTLTEPGFGSDSEVVRPYHAYSPSGKAYGKAVYVSHGREEDYRALAAAGVNVNGCIAVVKRGGGMSRNAVVVMAAERGVTAVVMFTDGNGNGVERGTVLDGVGDPLTPGWGASGGGDVERLRVEDSEVSGRFPVVPSMPVSAETAAVILGSLGGPRVAHIWKNGEVDQVRKFDRVGPGPTFLNFTYEVYGPASEGKLGFFPGVADAIYESKRQSVIQHEIWRVGRAIQRAASALKGELT
ncbi:putative glutamate carboxypeptidase [Helianthus anomalus]